MADQLVLAFPARHGGARPGAGRPKGSRTSERLPHVRRPPVSPHRPHHVTVECTRETWNLRSQRCFAPIRAALAAVRRRAGFRVVHWSVQRDHVHMIVEADDRRTMTNALKALLIRVARGVNRVMGARGRRFADRFHEHVLGTPSEVRSALRHVLRNRAIHRARAGAEAAPVDAFSSASGEPLGKRPRSWLLREGWQRAGPLDLE